MESLKSDTLGGRTAGQEALGRPGAPTHSVWAPWVLLIFLLGHGIPGMVTRPLGLQW